MALTSGMDSGPIYAQTKLKLSSKESKQDLANKLGDLGSKEISRLLSSKLPEPKEQTGQPTICNLIQKSDSKLDLTKSAEVLEREVRAYLGWPSSKATLKLNGGKELELTITAAAVTPSPSGEGWDEGFSNPLLLKTSKNYLQITKLKLPGKPEITSQDFINGYKSQLL